MNVRRSHVVVAVLVVATSVLGACSDDDDDVGATSTTTTDAPGDDTTTTSTTVEGDDLPGERTDFFPFEGAEVSVVGVAADDTLNVRAGPGTEFDVVTELAPTATGIVATGHNRDLGGSIWAEITVDGTEGWVNERYLMILGATEDITAQAITDGRPQAETMLELGQVVARPWVSEEPESDVVVVDGPTVGDLGEITVDVVGLPDDSVGGVRLHVFGEPAPGGEGFTLRTLEATYLCSRGGEPGGLCI